MFCKWASDADTSDVVNLFKVLMSTDECLVTEGRSLEQPRLNDTQEEDY